MFFFREKDTILDVIKFHTDASGLRSCTVNNVAVNETVHGAWLVTIFIDNKVKEQQWLERDEGVELYETIRASE